MRVALLVTCLVDVMRPSVGFAAIKLLQAAGCEVTVPAAQTCCGQPGFTAGDRQAALNLARKVVDEFADCEYVVAPSGSCGGMIRVHYPELLGDDPEYGPRAIALAQKTYELTDFLVSIAKIDRVPGNFTGELTYHDCCSGLRELGVQKQPRALLAKMPGVTISEMKDCATCCGFGGSFSVKFGDISAQMAANKCGNIHDSGAGAVVLGDLGCMLNIEGRLRREGDMTTRVLHVAEVLAGE